MEIRELDKAMRAAIEAGSMQPRLAALAGSGHVIRLPGEFALAAQTLSGRVHGQVSKSILNAKAKSWL